MAEASSASATKSDEEKVGMLDRLLTRLALCDDSNLQPLLSKLLPFTSSSRSSHSSAVRNKSALSLIIPDLNQSIHKLTDIRVHLFVRITSTVTFAAACASAGITVLNANDLNKCDFDHCKGSEAARPTPFISWFTVSPSFLLNFWSLASR